MYIFIISVICAVMLGGVYLIAYEDLLNAIGIAFLLFIAIDTGLRAVLNKPSWIVYLLRKKEQKKK